MIFHKNRLLADDSHEISYLIFFLKIRKDDAKFVVCCSRESSFKSYVSDKRYVFHRKMTNFSNFTFFVMLVV